MRIKDLLLEETECSKFNVHIEYSILLPPFQMTCRQFFLTSNLHCQNHVDTKQIVFDTKQIVSTYKKSVKPVSNTIVFVSNTIFCVKHDCFCVDTDLTMSNGCPKKSDGVSFGTEEVTYYIR